MLRAGVVCPRSADAEQTDLSRKRTPLARRVEWRKIAEEIHIVGLRCQSKYFFPYLMRAFHEGQVSIFHMHERPQICISGERWHTSSRQNSRRVEVCLVALPAIIFPFSSFPPRVSFFPQLATPWFFGSPARR